MARTVMPQRASSTNLICSSLSRSLPEKKAGRARIQNGSLRTRAGASRRLLLLSTPTLQISPAAVNVDLDLTTILNAILGAFGLPKLKESSLTRPFEDFDNGIYFEVPVAWVKRKNTLRPGVYFSNFDSGDRAVLEIFSDNEESALEQQLVSHFVNPAEEVGGDSRLMSPSSSRIKSATEKTSTQTYTYVDFPTETITRSGYQIKQKNFGVAVKKKGTVYTLVSSARSDKYDKAKEELLRGIIRSFRLDE